MKCVVPQVDIISTKYIFFHSNFTMKEPQLLVLMAMCGAYENMSKRAFDFVSQLTYFSLCVILFTTNYLIIALLIIMLLLYYHPLVAALKSCVWPESNTITQLWWLCVLDLCKDSMYWLWPQLVYIPLTENCLYRNTSLTVAVLITNDNFLLNRLTFTFFNRSWITLTWWKITKC